MRTVWTLGLALALPFAIAPLSCSADGGPLPQRGAGGSSATSATGCEAPATCFQECNCQTGQTESCATNCLQTGQVCNGQEDCSSCADCLDRCLCDTGSVTGCIIACGITPSGGSGGSQSSTGGEPSSGQGGTAGNAGFGGVGGQSGTGGDTGVGGAGGSGQGGTGGDPSTGGTTGTGGMPGSGGSGGSGGASGTGGSAGVGGTGGSTGTCGNDGTSWNVSWQAFECEVLTLTNQRRAQGATCGTTSYPPVGPLTRNAQLTDSAREHAQDMGDNNYFDHNSLDGSTPFDRMQDAGFNGSPMGENIAAGQRTPADVVNGWMNSPGHCKNIMLGSFRYLGVGYYYTASGSYHHLWVQNFGGS